MRDFHRLEIWRRAHALSVAIHDAVREMRGAEFATLRSQLTRAVDSIAANIVEGCGAATAKEFARFLDMSIKSNCEAEHHMLDARDRRGFRYGVWQKYSNETVEIRRMTYAYRKRVLDSAERKKGKKKAGKKDEKEGAEET